MNKYGHQAQRYWQEFLPSRYEMIADPVEYFTRVGEQMAQEVNALALRLAGDDPPGETYLGKVGRLRMARLQAEEQVIRETLPPSETEEQTSG